MQLYLFFTLYENAFLNCYTVTLNKTLIYLSAKRYRFKKKTIFEKIKM